MISTGAIANEQITSFIGIIKSSVPPSAVASSDWPRPYISCPWWEGAWPVVDPQLPTARPLRASSPAHDEGSPAT